jgi:glycosyltransferase involved in cell wall biosynthesis
MPKPLTISLIIPAHNEEKYLGPTLESVLKHASPALKEIFVVDNASDDDTAKVARKFPGVTVIREPRKGTGFARQAGLLRATGDIVAFIDADTRILPGWFARVEREFRSPKLLGLSGPYFFHDLPRWKRCTIFACWMAVTIPTAYCTRCVVSGGNFIARRSALLKIGGFDTSIAFYGDDTDVGRRLSALGRVKFLPSLVAYSSGRRVAGQGVMKTSVIYAVNFLSEVTRGEPVSDRYSDYR